jgi:tetratricopeptide (TPR) repeat protein
VPITVDIFTRNGVRALLKLWQSSSKLGAHPLAQTSTVNALRAERGYADSATGRGVALRDVLRARIDAFKPPGAPNYGEKRWRPYLILIEQYVNGRKPEYLAEQFGLVRGSFHQEQARALELLSDALREVFSDADAKPAVADPVSDDAETEAPPRTPFLAPTLPPTALIGRDALLADIKTALFARDEALVSISGLPGVGKTALAIALANDRDVLDGFNDGVLWAGLGPQPDLLGMLGGWAAALGFSRDDIARLNTLEARAAAIHTEIGFRRMLLVIDDVWQLDHADAFKLGGPNCAHVYTTRLPALALDLAGDCVFNASELNLTQSAALIASHAPNVVGAHGAAIDALISAVGGLPLALTLMGRRLRTASLGNQARRTAQVLQALTVEFAGHDGGALADVIASSEARVGPAARRALYALSVFPPKPGSFDEAAAVAAADCDIAVIDTLVDAGLVETIGDRLTLHQTIADYGRARLKTHSAVLERALSHYADRLEDGAETPTDDIDGGTALALLDAVGDARLSDAGARCAAALSPRLLQHGQLDAAERVVQPYLERGLNDAAIARFEPRLRLAAGRAEQRRGRFDQARAHFDRARALLADQPDARSGADALLALATLANDRGEREQADALGHEALTLARHVDDPRLLSAILTQLAAAAGFRAQFAESEAFLLEARAYAQRSGDLRAEALLSLGLGLIDSWLGQVSEGEADFAHGYALARRADARETASLVRCMQGWVSANLGDYDKAIAQSQESLALIREGSFCESAGLAYTNLGFVAMNRGQLDEAARLIDRGSAVVQQIGHREGECMMFNSRARIAAERGDWPAAEALAREGIRRCDDLDYWELMPSLMTTLGEACNAQGRYDDADGFLFTALLLADNMQRPWLTAYGHTVWGGCYLDREEIDKAAESFAEALAVAERLGAKPYTAVACFGLARVAAIRGDLRLAREQAERSLALFDAIGHVRAGQVRAWLASHAPAAA